MSGYLSFHFSGSPRMQVGGRFSGSWDVLRAYIYIPGGQVLDFVFVFDLLGLGSGLDIVWLAGWLAGALIILA